MHPEHDILQDLSKDIIRFMMLSKKSDVIIDFDIEVITNANLTVDYKYSNFRKPQK